MNLGVLSKQSPFSFSWRVKGYLLSCLRMVRVDLRYFIENPEAKDTSEGIRKWWFAESGVEQTREEVLGVLNFLVSERWVIKRLLSSFQNNL